MHVGWGPTDMICGGNKKVRVGGTMGRSGLLGVDAVLANFF